MCGISGIFSRSNRYSQDLASNVAAMVEKLKHRGPDDEGIWSNQDKYIALGHTRLAIIDLSVEGKQPMISHSGNLVLVLNGEIYNYIELRRELEQAGISFRGTSDTEVLLEAMEFWGIEAAIVRIRGMFALAVWDVAEKYLWLARDRIGKKPLYIYEDADAFIFASEIKGIRAVSRVKVNISQQSLSNYLSLGYITGNDTIYQEISEIRPGTLVRIGRLSNERKERTYWQFPNHASNVFSQVEIQEQIETRLKDAVRIRLRADVPVGVFLSGGIDSGLITALAAGQSSQSLKSFTVRFGNSTFDESELAKMVARRYGTTHHEIFLDPDLEDILPKVVKAYDEPFADPSALPTYAISAEASKHVKVVLNGEGSDELFGGYRRIYAMKILEKIQFIINRLPTRTVDSLVKSLPQPNKFRSAYSFLHRFVRAAQADPKIRYLLWSTDGFDEEEKLRLMYNKVGTQIQPTDNILRERLKHYSSLPPLAEFMAVDFLVGMTDCLLPKIDIATMAHGLEGRSPFLDHELVDWVAGIDKSNLLSGHVTKPMLRQLAKKYLPTELVTAPKRGFEIPLTRWMMDDLYSMVRDVCSSKDCILFDLFDRDEVINILDRKIPTDDDRWAKRIWPLFMLALWGQYCT